PGIPRPATTLIVVLGPVLNRVHLLSLSHDLLGHDPQPVLSLVRIHTRVRLNLGPIQSDQARIDHPCLRAHQQHLGKQLTELLTKPGPEPGNHTVIRHILSTCHPEGHIRHTPALDPPRGTLSHAVGIHQQPQQHVRVIPTPTHHRARGLTPTTTPMKPAGIDLLDHIQHYPHQVLSRQPIPHIRRQQERLITIHRTVRLRHTPSSQPTSHTPSTHAAQLATASTGGFEPKMWIRIRRPDPARGSYPARLAPSLRPSLLRSRDPGPSQTRVQSRTQTRARGPPRADRRGSPRAECRGSPRADRRAHRPRPCVSFPETSVCIPRTLP